MEIDRNVIYSVGDYSFKNFVIITDEEIKKVWAWRNEESIRRYMYNKDVIPFENHLHFIKSLGEREDVYYWLVERKGEVIGVTNLTSIDKLNSKAILGYYMIPEMQKKGLGVDFLYHNFVFAFRKVGLKTIYGDIDKRNYNALILDSYLGCVLNKEDLDNLEAVEYVRFDLDCEHFLSEMEGKNDFRRYIRYIKENQEFIERIKSFS